MICHDLTSPLSVVSAHAEMGKRGRPASWDAVTRAVEEQDRIVSFVRSHGELVELPVSGEGVSPVSVAEVLATLRFLFEGRARAKSIELEVCVVADDLRIWGEQATLIHSVLGNAVSNAIKFSNPGAVVKISLTESASASGDGWVELRVEDFGVGMPLALQQRILASRKGVHRPGTRGEPGTGYGLGLMRYFTESYGGTFSWNSRSAEDGFQQTGTTMVFRFRRVQATGLPHPAKSGTLGA
jgi:signal transduction histidine kinase